MLLELPYGNKRSIFFMRQYHTYSTELKLKTVKDYLSSGLSQKKFAEKAGINFHTLNSWIDKYSQCRPERKQFDVNQKENLIPISTIMEDNVLVAQSKRETIDLMIDGHHIELDRKDLGVLFGALKHD